MPVGQLDREMTISVRFEAADDAADVRDVNERAFGGPEEAWIVDALRGSADSISLVATVDDRVVGHILFTPVSVEPRQPGVRMAGLAPMAVQPEFQRAGVGGELVRAGLDECRRRGYTAVVVVGHPEYYPRFGFVPAHSRGLVYEEPLPPDVFMILELDAGALSGRHGVVRYRPEFASTS